MKLGVRQGSVLSLFLFTIYVNDIIGRYVIGQRTFVVLYANDILLISISICELQNLLRICEIELKWLNMAINANKSCCMNIGPQCDTKCANITTADGSVLPWVNEIRYLGVFFVQSRNFKISFDYAKRSFYRTSNAMLGKVDRFAAEPVVLQLFAKKCVPILLYGLEACPLNKADKSSLDFVLNRFLMKLFNTGNFYIIEECKVYFGIESLSSQLARKTENFVKRFNVSSNALCQFALNINS